MALSGVRTSVLQVSAAAWTKSNVARSCRELNFCGIGAISSELCR